MSPTRKSFIIVSTIASVICILTIVDLESLPQLIRNYTTDVGNITNEPFVYIQTRGRLGNQMFQFACGYTLAKKNRIPLFLSLPQEVVEDPSYPNKTFELEDSAEFLLHFFNIPLPTKDEYERLKSKTSDSSLIRIINDKDIMSGEYPMNKILRLKDYCQSEHLFLPYKEEIKSFFRLRKPYLQTESIKMWEERIGESEKTHESVCVHIRRGDFVVIENRLVDMSFYTNAMKEISTLLLTDRRNPPEFFIFSDEIDFLKDYFTGEEYNWTPLSPFTSSIRIDGVEEAVILNWVSASTPNMTSIEDFHLLSKCHHNILSGSSFGWWGAYLNDYKEQIVIAAHYKPESFSWWNPTRLFQYRHFYYPIGWIVKDADFAN